jgi:membrane-bound lytic murein transglycosylase D
LRHFFYVVFIFLGTFNAQSETHKTPILFEQNKAITVTEKIKPVTNENNLWNYIVNRSTLKAPDTKHLYWHIEWFERHPDYLTRVTKRAQPYLHLVTQEVERAGLPLEMALLPIVESAYYPFSYSHGTASGLWQFIPSTGKLYGLKNNWWYDGRRDVLASTKAAVRYLKNLNKLFKGDWLLTVAAYNSGPGRVQRAVRNNKAQGKPTDFWHLKLPEETRGYVPRLLAVAELIKHPEKYGQTITPVANQQAIQAIKLDTQFDLALIADWAKLELKMLHTLNPGLKRWATPNKSTYMLLLPNKNMGLFKQSMRNNPNMERLGWVRHKVKSGDNLNKIARKYRAIVDQIISVNNLKNSLIKVGDYLIVPIAHKQSDEYVLSEYQRGKMHPSQDRSKSKVIHNVESGDNLWRIAKRYQVSVENLIEWNLIKRPNLLKLGRKLVIWQTKAKKDFSLVTTLGININRKVSYRVKRGDNLSLIANKFGVNVGQLKQWNKLNDKPLQPRQKLTIMVNIINTNMK